MRLRPVLEKKKGDSEKQREGDKEDFKSQDIWRSNYFQLKKNVIKSPSVGIFSTCKVHSEIQNSYVYPQPRLPKKKIWQCSSDIIDVYLDMLVVQ